MTHSEAKLKALEKECPL